MAYKWSTQHVHQMGRPCDTCGYISLPNRFYFDLEKYPPEPRPYEEAVKMWREWMSENRPEVDIKAVLTRVVGEVFVDGEKLILTAKVCETCQEDFTGHGKNCSKCRVKKSRAKKRG